MRVIFMGNPQFAVPGLRALLRSAHQVRAVVTNPPKAKGRGQKIIATAVAEAAVEHGLPLIQPTSLDDEGFLRQLRDLEPDVFAVVAFRILPRSLLKVPKIGAVNVHASLLPRYRGAAPIQWSLINGETKTGVTTFLIEPKVDTGAIILQQSIPIDPRDNYGTLSDKLSRIGAELLVESLDQLETGRAVLVPQDHSRATKAPKITREDCLIHWSKPAVDIHNLVRGLAPVPAAYTTFQRKRIKIFETEIVECDDGNHLSGRVVKRTKKELIIRTGEGCLAIIALQREGKRPMKIHEFLQGTAIGKGDRLGD